MTEQSKTNTPKKIAYAGFWVRLFATLIDIFWMGAFSYWVLEGVFYLSDYQLNDDSDWFIFCSEFFMYLVLVLFFWMKKSATPGKMIFDLVVVDEATLKPASFARYLIRYLTYFISISPLFLGFICIAWNKRKQAAHDIVAKTVVIKKT